MPFPTIPNDAMRNAWQATDETKAIELIRRANLIKDLAAYISGEIPMRARRLADIQGSLFDHKNAIATQNLVTAGVRSFIAANDPQYANAAAVGADIQAVNSDFNQLTTEIETVLAQARAIGRFTDNDTVTGAKTELQIPEANMTSLRAFASSVQASLG